MRRASNHSEIIAALSQEKNVLEKKTHVGQLPGFFQDWPAPPEHTDGGLPTPPPLFPLPTGRAGWLTPTGAPADGPVPIRASAPSAAPESARRTPTGHQPREAARR
jgi:hypothetical protein